MKGFAESAAHHHGNGLNPADMVALLNVYTTQFGSFTTLLWQVPALGLTAQAFLMTIVLGAASSSISPAARYAAAALSIIVAFAAGYLMHDQRARAINHAELAKRVSYRLSLTNNAGRELWPRRRGAQQGADAQNVWTTNHVIYARLDTVHAPLRGHGSGCYLSFGGGLVVYLPRRCLPSASRLPAGPGGVCRTAAVRLETCSLP